MAGLSLLNSCGSGMHNDQTSREPKMKSIFDMFFLEEIHANTPSQTRTKIGCPKIIYTFFYAVMPLQVARGVAPTRPGAPSLETARSGHGAAVEKKL